MLEPDQFARLHESAFTDHGFTDAIQLYVGDEPDTRTWSELAPLLPGNSVLEIGPGSGHLLAAAAAAGRSVAGVETSETHRDFMLRKWGFSDTWPRLDAVPEDRAFDAAFTINTIEHVYDVASFLGRIRARLRPGGVLFVSTCNADHVALRLVRAFGAMCKPSDHVSIPSVRGLRHAGLGAGFRVERIWTGELPMETPFALAVGARDFINERIRRKPRQSSEQAVTAGGATEGGQAPLSRRLKWRIMQATRAYDPTSVLTAKFDVAGSVKVLLRRAEAS